MKKRKYAYMIVGGDNCISIGMEGPDGRKVSRYVPWQIVNDATIEANLDIMENMIDKSMGSNVDVKA